MSRNVIIAVVVGGLLLLGGVGYFVRGNSDDSATSIKTIDGVPVLSGDVISYPVTMIGTIIDSADAGSDGKITVAMQDENTWSMILTGEEGASEIIYTGEATYLQNPNDASWIKLPANQSASSPLGSVALTPGEFDQYQDNATYKGKQSCNQGTCDTWDWTNPDSSGDTATLKIGSGGRIAEVTGSSGTSTVSLIYDYDTPVNIVIPADAVELNVPQ